VAFEPAVEAERDEWFLAGTQTGLVATSTGANASAAVTPHIRYPAPETIIALDPDIADEHQRVVFQASPVLPGMQWRIGETVLADTHGRAAWSPLPGRYTLYLESEDGQALSSVAFEVRGNIAR
jgi:penicillin-binding protein 1C